MTEIMLEAAEKQEATGLTRGALENILSSILPYYALIERIRIHDFHRFGITPPNPKLAQTMLGGPIKVTGQKGSAMVAVTDQGLVTKTTGASQVQLQRPLLNADGEFFDDQSQGYVKLEDVLSAFLTRGPSVIVEFEGLISSEGEKSISPDT
jgi:hypothetical protein